MQVSWINSINSNLTLGDKPRSHLYDKHHYYIGWLLVFKVIPQYYIAHPYYARFLASLARAH